MSKLPGLGVSDAAMVFANGRSPVCWQRQVSHSAEWQKALAQACGWVGEMVQQPSPKLQPGPLLGGCLAELVAPAAGDEAPPAADRQAAERPRGASPAPHVAARPATRKQPFALPRPARRETLPTFPPAKARPDLLRRWAGETAVPPPYPPRRQPARPPAPPANSAPSSSQSTPTWTDHLLKRTRDRFAPEATAVAPPTGSEAAAGRHNHWSGGALTLEKPSASLDRQWQQAIAGQTAPLALLERLQAHSLISAADAAAKSARPSGTAPEQVGKTAVSPAAPAIRPANPTAAAAFAALGQNPRRTAPPALPPPDGRERPSASPLAHHDETAVPESTPSHPDDADDGWYAAPRFAPPQMAEVLPRLRPLPKPGASNLSPIAAATAERSARREAESAPTDLDALARQIKQILDEESRRHGIDV